MLIDWFTIIAQIVNFLILIALLKYFLYGRILRAMDRREAEIAARISDAEETQRAFEAQRHEYQDKTRELEEERQQILAGSRDEAGRLRQEMVENAREEVSRLDARWRESLLREKTAFLEGLRRMAATGVLTVSRKALAALANADLERVVVAVFLEKLRQLREEDWSKISEATGTDRGLAVLSAFEIPATERRQIETVLGEHVADIPVRFQIDPNVACGLELRVNGYAAGWSVREFLDRLEDELRDELLRVGKEELVGP